MSPRQPVTSRRRFLARSGAGLVVLSGLAAAGCGVLITPDPRAVAAELAGLLKRHDLATRIGRIYIEAAGVSRERTLESLTLALLQDLDIDLETLTVLPVENLANALAARIRQDFADENVVVVDGWLLSVAEARACGIVHLHEA